jgi:integrase
MTGARVPGGYRVRLRFGRDAAGKEQRERFLIVTDDPGVAEDREVRMRAAGDTLAHLRHAKARDFLIEMGRAAHDERKFRALERALEQLAAEAAAAPPAAVASGPSTFRDVAEMWTSGRLTELYPDHDRCPPKDKEARAADRGIVSTFYPAIGSRPIASLTQEDIDAARRLIPKDLHPNTRRIYAVKLRFVLRLAEDPLHIVEHAARVSIPKRKPSNIFGYLYPQEEALLLGCRKIPPLYRVLYGYLTRNGCRVGESLQLTWDHIDLHSGDIHIDRAWTKTKVARKWVLDTDVLAAFVAWRRLSGEPSPESLVFPGRASGKRIRTGTIWARFLQDLAVAGVTRRVLLKGADGINPLRVHDLRASFVTLAMRSGRDLKWIMTRTGHETLGVLQGYDRLVQDAEEHRLPKWFTPMDRAIPELRSILDAAGPTPGQPPHKSGISEANRSFITDDEAGAAEHKTSGESQVDSLETPLTPTPGPAEFQGAGQLGPVGPDPVAPGSSSLDQLRAETAAALVRIEESLAQDLKALIAAGRYELADKVMAELRDRRLQRTAPRVTSLESARAKRERNGDK